MRERKIIPVRRPAKVSGRAVPGPRKRDYAEELMDLVMKAADSRELPVFLAGLAERAAEMLDSDWGGVTEILGNKLELYTRGRSFPGSEIDKKWLLQNAGKKRPGLDVYPFVQHGSLHCAFYPIYASDRELMGTLCLVRKTVRFSAAEEKLLAALGSYAVFPNWRDPKSSGWKI